jgi:glyoxylase-like metal-dependent hydrolase (beta-lactamase superfamily II)
VADAELLPADGSRLGQLPGAPVIVDTPGHTHGHVALHFPERDCVIVGDALVTLDPYTDRRGPRLVAKAATADSRLAWISLRRLAGLDRARVVLGGHGPAWTEGIAEAVDLARTAGQA